MFEENKKGNQNTYIEEKQTTQWPKEKIQKDKQRSTKHTHKTKNRVTRAPLKTEDDLRCSGRVDSSCSTNAKSLFKITSGTRRVNLVWFQLLHCFIYLYSFVTA